ncbi:MAG: shikimate dehydrogenase [Novosphingobium sp.]|nr:shikimate dehydrogenase [Novosphingobium sp.]
MSRAYAEVIGDPIAHSKSPAIHNFWLGKLGINAEYRCCHVGPDELAGYVLERRADPDWRGCNVTIPHKQAVLTLLDSIAPDARAIGAVNTVGPCEGGVLLGRNTDVEGIRRALDGIEVRGQRAVLLGAGGAARAAAFALKQMQPATVTVMNRSAAKAEQLLTEFQLDGIALPLGPAPEAELVINATSLGMGGQPPLPVTLEQLPAGAAVFDMVYAPLETELLREARRRRLRTIDGLTMLVGQAAAAFSTFFGAEPPREHDAELRALLTA